MKALFVGDVHNHHYMFDDIERLDKENNFDRIVFLGDYVDDWQTTNKESIETLNKVFSLKTSNKEKYTLCIGNHEMSYLGFPCSGHQYTMGDIVEDLLMKNLDLIDLYGSVILDDGREFICTHSGIVNAYADKILYNNWKVALNEMNGNKKAYLSLLTHCSYLRGGTSPFSSFIWADRRELISSANEAKLIIPHQIVGHSPVVKVTNLIPRKDEELWFTDTHSTYVDGSAYGDKSYLMWSGEKFEIIY